MSKLSVKEFSAAIKKPEGTIKSHIHRGKLIKDTGGFIDTDNEVNRRYIVEETGGKGLFYPVAPASAVAPDGDTSKKQPPVKPELSEREQLMLDTETRQKIANAQRAEQEAELKRIQLEKAAGNLLPVELVEKIIVINVQNVFKTFEGEIENIASIYTEVFGGGRVELFDDVHDIKL